MLFIRGTYARSLLCDRTSTLVVCRDLMVGFYGKLWCSFWLNEAFLFQDFKCIISRCHGALAFDTLPVGVEIFLIQNMRIKKLRSLFVSKTYKLR